jgi:hypothetical protein
MGLPLTEYQSSSGGSAAASGLTTQARSSAVAAQGSYEWIAGLFSSTQPTPSDARWASVPSARMYELPTPRSSAWVDDDGPSGHENVTPALYVLLPMLVILSTLLLMLISFLIVVLFVKRRRAIRCVTQWVWIKLMHYLGSSRTADRSIYPRVTV